MMNMSDQLIKTPGDEYFGPIVPKNNDFSMVEESPEKRLSNVQSNDILYQSDTIGSGLSG